MTRRFSRRYVFLLIGIGLLAYACFIPTDAYNTTYRGVSDDETGDDVIVRREPYQPGKPQFVIVDDRLYLEVRRVRPTRLIKAIAYRFQTQWTPQALAAFRGEHPGLEGFWPVPAAADAGVAWIGAGAARTND